MHFVVVCCAGLRSGAHGIQRESERASAFSRVKQCPHSPRLRNGHAGGGRRSSVKGLILSFYGVAFPLPLFLGFSELELLATSRSVLQVALGNR